MYKISPTIDTKVCNKKVAVDDSFGAKGMVRLFAYEGGTKSTGTWSCVDYEGTDRTHSTKSVRGGRGNELMTARYGEPMTGGEENTLSKRFGDAKGSELKHEDGPGNCRYADNRNWKKSDCAGTEPVGDRRGDDVDPVGARWYTGKQTNRGWPGTAEGKINTAQGMAGDLVSNLDSEEKSAVAGI